MNQEGHGHIDPELENETPSIGVNLNNRLPNASRHAHKTLARCNRAVFLNKLSLGILAAVATISDGPETTASGSEAVAHSWKGRKNPKVNRWDVITIGNLSRNRYWGESDAKGVRSAICTCTVIQGEGFRLIVDPALSDAGEMFRELDRRTGLKPSAISAAFVTHEHGDHWVGLAHFPDARWFAAPDVAAALNKTAKLPKPVEPATDRLFETIEILPTLGHTLSHHSLRFDCGGVSVVVAGDAVATQDFWRERRGYYNCVDFALSAKSMDKIAGLADVVIPGHDNYFLAEAP